MSTGCKPGAFSYSHIYRKIVKSDLSQREPRMLWRCFLNNNTWCRQKNQSVTGEASASKDLRVETRIQIYGQVNCFCQQFPLALPTCWFLDTCFVACLILAYLLLRTCFSYVPSLYTNIAKCRSENYKYHYAWIPPCSQLTGERENYAERAVQISIFV